MTALCQFQVADQPVPPHILKVMPDARAYRCTVCGNVMYVTRPAETIYSPCSGPPERVGLGDLVAKLLKIIGVEPSENCKCEHRRQWLNKLLSWRTR